MNNKVPFPKVRKEIMEGNTEDPRMITTVRATMKGRIKYW
jgi:hypothetical protein